MSTLIEFTSFFCFYLWPCLSPDAIYTGKWGRRTPSYPQMLSLLFLILFSGVGPGEQGKQREVSFCSACGEFQSMPCLGPKFCLGLFPLSLAGEYSSQKVGAFMRQIYWPSAASILAVLWVMLPCITQKSVVHSHISLSSEFRTCYLNWDPAFLLLHISHLFLHVTPATYLLTLFPYTPARGFKNIKMTFCHHLWLWELWMISEVYIWFSWGSPFGLGWGQKYPVPLYEVSKGGKTVHYSRRVPLILPIFGLLFQLGVIGSWPQC
jgi:hypothetical protein